MAKDDSYEMLPFPTQQAFSEWLEEHHQHVPGIWLQFAKNKSGIASVTYAEALEIALCFGWIDGQKRSIDEYLYAIKFTPRRAKSIWSQVNKEKALQLIAEGKMRPAGHQQIELAKKHGLWERAYASQKNMTIPDDLQAALLANPEAHAFFNTLDSRNRYAILYRITQTASEAKRQVKIVQFIEQLSRQEKIYP